MKEFNIGSLPVCSDDRLDGMITDRDIVLRSVAEGKDPHRVTVDEVMSPGIEWCREDQDIDEVSQKMKEKKIRRLPVVNSERRLAGIISLGDMAVEGNDDLAAEALRGISQPAHPKR